MGHHSRAETHKVYGAVSAISRLHLLFLTLASLTITPLRGTAAAQRI